MIDYNELLERYLAIIKEEFPKFKLIDKESTWWSRTLGKIFPFWKTSCTTIFPYVFVPADFKRGPRSALNVMQHEHVHMKDAATFFGLMPAKLKVLNVVLFSLGYSAPACLFVPLALGLAFVSPWLLFLLLAAFIPWPRPGAAYAELRAYRRTLELTALENRATVRTHIVEHFSSRGYWFMWPFKRGLAAALNKSSPYRAKMNEIFK